LFVILQMPLSKGNRTLSQHHLSKKNLIIAAFIFYTYWQNSRYNPKYSTRYNTSLAQKR